MDIEKIFEHLPTHIYSGAKNHRLICYPWLDGRGCSLEYEDLIHVDIHGGESTQYLYELMFRELEKTDYFVKKETYGHISLTDDKEDSTGKTFEVYIFNH